MATDDKLSQLLQESIEASNRTTQASNRTTHAVRALVRFLFIQLSFLTAAFVVWQIGLAFPDEDNCSAFGCEPNLFVVFLVVTLIIVGVVLSSKAGWDELQLSEVSSSPEITYQTYGTHVESAATPTSRYPTGGINPKVTPRNNEDASEGRVCSECVKYTTKVYCEHCGDKE
jgi:uncharacterized membrane protein YidH (DUF202 family)